MKPVRNCMISTVQLLFLKTSSGPPCSLGTEKFGCTLCWIIFESPQSIILKNFFQWKSWLLQILSHPLAEQHGASAVSRPPYFLETHVLVEVTGDIKIFLECPEKCRPNPIFFSSLSWFWWEFTWLMWQNCNNFFFQEKNPGEKRDCKFT